jgi:hypothetical protein
MTNHHEPASIVVYVPSLQPTWMPSASYIIIVFITLSLLKSTTSSHYFHLVSQIQSSITKEKEMSQRGIQYMITVIQLEHRTS